MASTADEFADFKDLKVNWEDAEAKLARSEKLLSGTSIDADQCQDALEEMTKLDILLYGAVITLQSADHIYSVIEKAPQAELFMKQQKKFIETSATVKNCATTLAEVAECRVRWRRLLDRLEPMVDKSGDFKIRLENLLRPDPID